MLSDLNLVHSRSFGLRGMELDISGLISCDVYR